MDTHDVAAILDEVAAGTVAPADAARSLARLPFADLGPAMVDHHRSLRQGMPEAVYAPGKQPDEVALITHELLEAGSGPVIVTRADDAQASAVRAVATSDGVELSESPGNTHTTLTLRPAPKREARVVLVTAGTADGPVADECEAVLLAMGLAPTVLRDRGVAGLHRLLDDLDVLFDAEVTVVIAGMEGALASVVGGLARGPVIAVPTSVGYGSSLEGVTALLSMLSSCAAGVSVVGIDNGFGAAMAVVRALDTVR
jgi:NCAIR mutase (PurE)-related protein